VSVLAVGAHFDDLELGCGGALINHVRQGEKVVMVVVTDSAYADPDGRVVRDAGTALAEGRRAAALIGAELVCLGFPTFAVPDGEELARELVRLLELHRPHTVYTHWTRDSHRDHRNTGLCTLMAARHVPRLLLYRSNLQDSDTAFAGTVYADITAVMDLKMRAVAEHRSELARVDQAWLEQFRGRAAADGAGAGTAYAERFQAVRYLADPLPSRP
jgi:N-acetylglucosamine malate deacetylase 1